MTSELHDYLLKCVLEELETGTKDDVEELCSCRLGLMEQSITTTTDTIKQGE